MSEDAVTDAGAPPGWLRRARALVGHWEDGELILENYLSHRRTAVSPAVAVWLGAAESYTAPDALAARLGGEEAEALVRSLAERDLLVTAGSPLDARDRDVAAGWPWGPAAAWFHHAARHVAWRSLEEERSALAGLAARTPPPSPYLHRGGERVALPGTQEDDTGEMWDVLRARRTRRRFAPRPVPREDFARVLLWTWGRSRALHDPVLGDYQVKTSPSAGSRHPVEVYPLVLDVDGVEPGLYHYDVRDHGLERMRAGRFAAEAVRLCADQEWVGGAGAVCFMTAVVPRSAWKYRQPHAYRVIHLDAGHLGQTFHLVCTRLGLAPFTTAAARDGEIEAFLELDGVDEIPLYVAAFGVRED